MAMVSLSGRLHAPSIIQRLSGFPGCSLTGTRATKRGASRPNSVPNAQAPGRLSKDRGSYSSGYSDRVEAMRSLLAAHDGLDSTCVVTPGDAL